MTHTRKWLGVADGDGDPIGTAAGAKARRSRAEAGPDAHEHENGVAALELAMVLPLLFTVVASVLFAGWLGVTRAVLEHGAGEGARHATIPATSDLRTYPTAAEVAARVEAATPLLSPTSVSVTPASGGRNQLVTVEVTFSFTFPFIDNTMTMTSTAKGRRE